MIVVMNFALRGDDAYDIIRRPPVPAFIEKAYDLAGHLHFFSPQTSVKHAKGPLRDKSANAWKCIKHVHPRLPNDYFCVVWLAQGAHHLPEVSANVSNVLLPEWCGRKLEQPVHPSKVCIPIQFRFSI